MLYQSLSAAISVPRDIPDSTNLVGEQSLPLQVGTIAVTRDGRLVRRDHAVPLHFGFVYAGVPFAAEVTATKGIRFRAEAVPPAPRTPASVMATVAALLLEWKPCLTLPGELLAADPFLRRPVIPAAPRAEA